MAQKKGLGALEFARVPARKPDELADYSGDNVPYKFRSLGDIEFRADMDRFIGDDNLRRLGFNIVEQKTGGDYGKMIKMPMNPKASETDVALSSAQLTQIDAELDKLVDFYNDENKEGGRGFPSDAYTNTYNMLVNRKNSILKNPTTFGTTTGGSFMSEDKMQEIYDIIGEKVPEKFKGYPQITANIDRSQSEELIREIMSPRFSKEEQSRMLKTLKDIPGAVLAHELGHLAMDEISPYLSEGSFNEEDLLGLLDKKTARGRNFDPRVAAPVAYANFRDEETKRKYEDRLAEIQNVAKALLEKRGAPPAAVPVAYRPYDDAAVRRARVGPTGVTPKEKSFMERLKGLIGMSAGGIASIRKA